MLHQKGKSPKYDIVKRIVLSSICKQPYEDKFISNTFVLHSAEIAEVYSHDFFHLRTSLKLMNAWIDLTIFLLVIGNFEFSHTVSASSLRIRCRRRAKPYISMNVSCQSSSRTSFVSTMKEATRWGMNTN